MSALKNAFNAAAQHVTGKTPLQHALLEKTPNVDIVKRLLQSGADPDAGRTPNIDIVKRLLQSGADPDAGQAPPPVTADDAPVKEVATDKDIRIKKPLKVKARKQGG